MSRIRSRVSRWTVLLSACALPLAAEPPARPNVIVLLTDDMGYGDLSCHGNPVLRTPAIDRLHDESVRFTDFHVAPVCTPTRSQLLTGLDALRNRACCVPAGRNIIRRDVPTMAEIFRAGGYRTGLFGKWHLGDTYPDRPMERGFEKAAWFHGWGMLSEIEFDNDCVNVRWMDGLEVRRDGRYCTDVWFEEAIRWMDERRKKGEPFFCYLPVNAAHWPTWVEEKYGELYRGKGKDVPEDFFGMIANLDDNVGRLEKWLTESGAKDGTLLVYMHDNGGTAGRKLYNAGLREGKGSTYDGGHRSPCFVRWPGGGLGAPRDVGAPAQIQDLLPTFIELCGLQPPAGARFDGRSLASALKDAKAVLPDRMFVVQYGGRIDPKKDDACVVWNRWRLVNGRELYDIVADRAQAKDVSAEHPDVVRKMADHYERWWAEAAPGPDEYVPVVIDPAKADPVLLTSNTWADVDVDNCNRVAAAEGGPRGGVWNLQVERAGDYEIELRRWPFHVDRPLTSAGPETTISGRPFLKEVKRLPIAEARLSVNGEETGANPVPERGGSSVAPAHGTGQGASDGALGIVFQVRLPAGRVKLQGWFRDAEGRELCGAYYAKVKAR